MKKNFKRVLSAALVVVMLFTAFPAAFAFGSKETDYTIISPMSRSTGTHGKLIKQTSTHTATRATATRRSTRWSRNIIRWTMISLR